MSEGLDLFGEVATPPSKARGTQANGYAWTPGTGPNGETCGSCASRADIRLASTYHKCELARSRWTHGRATDILLGSPACRLWTACAVRGAEGRKRGRPPMAGSPGLPETCGVALAARDLPR